MDLVTAYKDLTEAIAVTTGFSRPMLHVHAGMAFYVLSQLTMGTRRGSALALATVLAAELGNEVMNRLYWGSWRWDDTIRDVVVTLFWPLACVAVSKFRRWRWSRIEARPTLQEPVWSAASISATA